MSGVPPATPIAVIEIDTPSHYRLPKYRSAKSPVAKNEPGHFKLPAANVTYVVKTLWAQGIPVNRALNLKVMRVIPQL
jgi:hypothetical protein